MRSGDAYMGYGFLRHADIYGYYWSRDGAAATNAYNLGFGASGINPSYGPSHRYYGFSLRCLQE